MKWARFELTPASPLHVGAGRKGMLLPARTFVPGHVLTHALAACIGAARGAKYSDFQAALHDIARSTRFGPAFVIGADGRALTPVREQEAIARDWLGGRLGVALHYRERAAAESALFEVEGLLPSLHGGGLGARRLRLGGVCWYEGDDVIDGKPLSKWLSECVLGGERKSGWGRVVSEIAWISDAADYWGHGTVGADGLTLEEHRVLPGPALNCPALREDRPLEPWLGRAHDKEKGFGRRITQVCFVRVDAALSKKATFLPSGEPHRMGFWAHVQ